jgi:hypothetical protein
MQYNQEAYNEFKKAKSSYDAVQVVGFVGGFLIEWPVGTALRGGDPQWWIGRSRCRTHLDFNSIEFRIFNACYKSS